MTTATAMVRAASPEQEALRESLVAAGLFLPTGVPGVVGHGRVFVELVRAVNDLVTRTAVDEDAEPMSFPAVMPRSLLVAGGYLGSFPHLAGTLFSFEGSEARAREQAATAAAGQDWSGYQSMTDLAMAPAACHPIYPAVAARGPLPAAGLTVDSGMASVFRHEPSDDPSRLQAFHMRELVRFGAPDDVLAWRNTWRDRSEALLSSLGLDVVPEEASDPFFGRIGRMMAASQREQALKFELLVPVAAPVLTAVASFNAHREHFTEVYGITLAGGGTAHTACLGFGIERVSIALLSRHGLAPTDWPDEVRAVLWP